MTTRIHFGAGTLKRLPAILASHRVDNVLLVSGQSAYAGSGAERVVSALPPGVAVHRFSDFTRDPKIEEVERAVQMLREKRCDAVVAIGGGTALDIAKAAAALAAQDGSPSEAARRNAPLRPRNCLLVMVPTTAGSGSEATAFSVMYVDGVKHSLDDASLRADYAIVDPELTSGAPWRVAASAGLDAMCQAIESLWSVRSTSASRVTARKAIRLATTSLAEYMTRPGPTSRARMARAALLAGGAIDVTRTTGPHAVAYGLSALFGIPHGHSCALTLPAFLVYNARVTDADVLDARGTAWVRDRIREILDLLGASNVERGRARLIEIMNSTGLESHLGALNLGPTAVERLIERGFDPARAANNPRRLTSAGVREVLALSM